MGPVEFIGLERWDAKELLEAIRRLAPDKPLAACAVTMKSDSVSPMLLSSATLTPNPPSSSCLEMSSYTPSSSV